MNPFVRATQASRRRKHAPLPPAVGTIKEINIQMPLGHFQIAYLVIELLSMAIGVDKTLPQR
jgi:hypothetical protein